MYGQLIIGGLLSGHDITINCMSRRVTPAFTNVPVESLRHSVIAMTTTAISPQLVGVNIKSPVIGSKYVPIGGFEFGLL